MINGTSLLSYGLYHDPARTSAWGINLKTVVASTGTGRHQSLSVYGGIFSNQEAQIGNYSDSVVVVITY